MSSSRACMHEEVCLKYHVETQNSLESHERSDLNTRYINNSVREEFEFLGDDWVVGQILRYTYQFYTYIIVFRLQCFGIRHSYRRLTNILNGRDGKETNKIYYHTGMINPFSMFCRYFSRNYCVRKQLNDSPNLPGPRIMINNICSVHLLLKINSYEPTQPTYVKRISQLNTKEKKKQNFNKYNACKS